MGSSNGIGKAIAGALAREGARVALHGRDPERLQEALRVTGAEVSFARDLTRPGEGAALVHDALSAFGGIDILVTNAGGPPAGRFEDISEESWRRGFQSLWLSATDAIRAALPSMRRERWGRILMITSTSAREPIAGLTVSNGLRPGLLGLANSLSREVAADGITVNAILPGYTRTERLAELGVPMAELIRAVPAGRIAEPSELADLALFLASQRASYVTGQAIACDGGRLHSI